jgi:hypothetical protein
MLIKPEIHSTPAGSSRQQTLDSRQQKADSSYRLSRLVSIPHHLRSLCGSRTSTAFAATRPLPTRAPYSQSRESDQRLWIPMKNRIINAESRARGQREELKNRHVWSSLAVAIKESVASGAKRRSRMAAPCSLYQEC